jgi:CRISPR-associated protein Cas2
MSAEVRTYLIAYDISDDKRRAHVATTLKHYGKRLQYSLFLLELRPVKLILVAGKIEDLIDAQADSIVICDAGQHSQSKKALQFMGQRTYEDMKIPTVL